MLCTLHSDAACKIGESYGGKKICENQNPFIQTNATLMMIDM